jgi:nicotinamidase/pyrazinamidase
MRDALLVIDVQNDFCPGGALAVPQGDQVVTACNALATMFSTVVFTQDWHPAGHASFASSHAGVVPYDTLRLAYGPQVAWPDHCVQGSAGAEFHRSLHVHRASLVVRKGTNPTIDSYSAFYENDRTTPTGLGGALRELGVSRVVLCGLATDFCVKYTALDARRLGLQVLVVDEACRGIDLDGSVATAWSELAAAGCVRVPRVSEVSEHLT